jgi:hypothetical protein
MKNVIKPLILLNLLIHFFFFINIKVSGQEKLNLYGGVGIPEQFVIGPRFQFDQVQIGLGYGISEYQNSISGDVSYHFGGFSQKSDRRPWYIKGGLSKWIDPEKLNDYPLGIYFRTGRDINFSKKIGLNVELGILTGGLANELYGNSGILPCLAIFLFYRM